MNYPRTAAGYSEYLQSEHWDILRTCVLERDGRRCVRCGSTKRLQAHHKVYRDDWEQSQPGDLETLCRSCHEKEHPDKQSVTVTVTVNTERFVPSHFSSTKELHRARSQGLITREEFLRFREQMRQSGRWVKPKGIRRRKRPHSKYPRSKRTRHGYTGCKPWHYSPRRMHWVNRDRSSN